ncbi:aminoacyl-tRNA deacylase [Paenibacillus thalictri]|uniref:YbaK/aminoacyl-tRNA synthetase-associated domain-containing protein n=1 Tax=Paenibacillus thalictri TaxID=2527873 RepID=A0A4Q9DZS5_9BACL|nr:YbaK/EbsC family protein [Paenibacillus thalictri]TBL81353.1 hypothetical protein EYB31_04530 [Paenibacillus thalictri]
MRDIAAYLRENQILYEIIEHDVTLRSAQEGAAYFGIEMGQTAPTLILKSDTEYFAMIVSGDYGHIDFEQMKDRLRCDQLKLAKPKEVEQATGFAIGAVPLVGHGLPVVMDRQLYRYAHIYGGTGYANSTLKLAPGDVEKLNRVVAMVR